MVDKYLLHFPALNLHHKLPKKNVELRKARLALLHVLHPLAVGHLDISVVHFSFQHNSESSEKFFVFGGTSITFIFTVIQILLKLRILPCGKGPPTLLNNVKKLINSFQNCICFCSSTFPSHVRTFALATSSFTSSDNNVDVAPKFDLVITFDWGVLPT